MRPAMAPSSAGSSPVRSATAAVTRSAKRRMRPSSAIALAARKLRRQRRCGDPAPTIAARATPSAPAASPSTALSASICRDEPGASGAQRGAHRQLLGALGVPREEEAGGARAGGEEEQRDRRRQHEQRGADVAEDLLLERHQAHARAGHRRVRGDDERAQLRFRGRRGHAGAADARRRSDAWTCGRGARARSEPGARRRPLAIRVVGPGREHAHDDGGRIRRAGASGRGRPRLPPSFGAARSDGTG